MGAHDSNHTTTADYDARRPSRSNAAHLNRTSWICREKRCVYEGAYPASFRERLITPMLV